MPPKSAPDVWMPLYIGAYLRKTARLTTEQHGAYLLLIMDYWVAGPPPDDDVQLASVARLSPAAWKRMRPRLEPYFTISDGCWHNERADRELTKWIGLKAQKSNAGKASAEAKRQRNANGNSTGVATDPQTERTRQVNPSPSPSPSPQEETSLRSVSIPRSTRGKPKIAIAQNWILSDLGRGYAESKGYDDPWIDRESEAFRDHAVTHDSRYADWEAAWRTWVQNAPKFAGKPGAPNGRIKGPATKLFEGAALAVEILNERDAEDDSGPDIDAA